MEAKEQFIQWFEQMKTDMKEFDCSLSEFQDPDVDELRARIVGVIPVLDDIISIIRPYTEKTITTD